MDRLAFTSLGAMNSQSTIRAQISNNLANVATTVLKRVTRWHLRQSSSRVRVMKLATPLPMDCRTLSSSTPALLLLLAMRWMWL